MDQELIKSLLQEIDSLLKRGELPVDNNHLGHLSPGRDMLAILMTLRGEGLISGDLITTGADRVRPHRMTNIRLTYIGIKMLRSLVEQSAVAS